MATLPTTPRHSWLERMSLVLAGSLVLLGAGTLAGWWLNIDALVQPLPGLTPISVNSSLCVFLLGCALLARCLGVGRAMPAFCLPPAVLAALTLGEYIFHADFRIDELFVRSRLIIDGAQSGRMSLISASCLLLAALALAWRGGFRTSHAQVSSGAVVGSLLLAVGFSTLIGYAASLPAVYSWGTDTAIPPVTGAALLLLGSALLLLAWRDALATEGGPPRWAPLPAIIGCLTLTLILWIGLSARERSYISVKTQTAMEGLATTIKYELDHQKSLVERLAGNWGSSGENATVVWETDAHLHMDELAQLGCVSLSWVTPGLRTTWVYPQKGNEGAVNFDHRSDEVRLRALDEAGTGRLTVISGSAGIGGRGKGFVIYAPVTRAGQPVGYVAAEFLYGQLFADIILDHKLAADYHISVGIGTETLYDSDPGAVNHNPDLVVDKAYPIFDRRIRLSFSPSESALVADRRFLPELALFAGIGITILLGLSVHLARSARAGQRAAELSNRKLLAENEERRRVEERLKVSDERLRLALDSTQIGIFEWGVTTGHVYYSPGLWAMLGYDHTRMPATIEAWQSLVHPDDLEVYRQRVATQLDGSATFIEPEYRVRAAAGEWRWVYTRAKAVASDPAGRPLRIIGTVQDITARYETALALRASQAEARKLSLVASKTDNPVLIGSPEGIIEWVNESFTRVMEYTLEEVVGRNPAEFMVGPDTNPRTVVLIRAAMARGRGLSTDVVNYSKSGRKYYLHLEIQPVRNDAGQLENFIAIESDITARVETEAQLRRARAEAVAASRAKSEFLASMSHEIRTPMNGVIGMTSLLMESQLTPEQREFVNTIRISGEALLTVINDILDFSKIESGKMDLEHMPFELINCLEETLDLFALQASSKKLELVYFVDPGVPAWIIGDVTRLRQILVNLVNNAVKFTPRGSIAVEVRVSTPPAAASSRLGLEFTVRDTGIGIPPDRVDRLFKAFSQIDSSTTRKYGGTGLGLVISQRLCALMGGDIRVDSTVGQGATFAFNIQTEAATLLVDVPPAPLAPALRAGPVLCVEDHPVTQKRLRVLLESVGATCVFAPSTAAAQALIPTLDRPPALVLLDGDETETISPLDTLLYLKTPRLLMLPFGQTAPATPADGLPFVVVYKPLKTTTLMQALVALGNPPSKLAGARGTALLFDQLLAREYPLDVLLAEDNVVNQKVALRFLERLGYRADTVGNGLEAITALEARHYHLVLMDLQMPEMDGLEASRQIRRRLPPDRQPKIIAITANAMQGDRELCLQAGMDDYISKPVKLHEISAAIRRLFSKAGTPALPRTIG